MPSFQIGFEKVNARKQFFVQRLEDLQTPPQSDFRNYTIHDDAALATAEAYFLLNDAYKAKRGIPDDHKTEFSKVAALTALAIGYLCPVRHKEPHRDSNLEDQLVNPKFGVRLAMQCVDADMGSMTYEELDRLYEGFSGFTFPTLEKYYASFRGEGRQICDPFDIEFSVAEMIFIEDKITIFALCERLAKLEKTLKSG